MSRSAASSRRSASARSAAVRDHLGQHRVVVAAHDAALDDAGVDPDPVAGRLVQTQNDAAGGEEDGGPIDDRRGFGEAGSREAGKSGERNFLPASQLPRLPLEDEHGGVCDEQGA